MGQTCFCTTFLNKFKKNKEKNKILKRENDKTFKFQCP